jgi:drug/metabolite transporter (DMT)-like permease
MQHGQEVRGAVQYLAFLAMCGIWGTTFLVIRIGNESVAPLWSASLRLVIASVLGGLIAFLSGARWPRGQALRGIAVFGILNLGLSFVLLYWAELTVPSGVAAVLYATTAVTTALFAWWLGVHPIERVKLLAAFAGLAGVALIFWGELRLGAPGAALFGVFVGAVLASLAGVILKTIAPHSTFVVNSIGAAIGAGVCFLGSWILGEARLMPHTVSAWAPILYLAIAGNLGAYGLYAWLLTQWKVTSVSAGALVVPVIAMIVGAVARSEAPAPATYAGGVLVLGGVAAALFAGSRSS